MAGREIDGLSDVHVDIMMTMMMMTPDRDVEQPG
jgi:hypothetical protein